MKRQLNSKGDTATTVVLIDGKKIKLNNIVNNKPLTYAERMTEIQNKILNNADFMGDCETYWFGIRNKNGSWSEKVKSCLDVITTYLLRAPDSGIKNAVLH
jgi:hypothetical protein